MFINKLLDNKKSLKLYLNFEAQNVTFSFKSFTEHIYTAMFDYSHVNTRNRSKIEGAQVQKCWYIGLSLLWQKELQKSWWLRNVCIRTSPHATEHFFEILMFTSVYHKIDGAIGYWKYLCIVLSMPKSPHRIQKKIWYNTGKEGTNNNEKILGDFYLLTRNCFLISCQCFISSYFTWKWVKISKYWTFLWRGWDLKFPPLGQKNTIWGPALWLQTPGYNRALWTSQIY